MQLFTSSLAWGNIVVESISRVRFFATPWTAAHQAPLSFTISQNVLKLMSIESVMLSNHLILCHLLLLLPVAFPSIRVFSNESALCIRWPKYWSFSINPSNEYSRLISLRIDWFDLPAGQRTLRSLLQHHNSKASIEHQCSTFSHTHTWLLEKPKLWLYGPLSAMMSLLFNTLSRSA